MAPESQPDIEIVEATKFDISELLRLSWTEFKELGLLDDGIEFSTEAMAKVLLDIMADPLKGVVFVAKHPTKEKKFVGKVIAAIGPFHYNPSLRVAWLADLWIEKKFRGKDIDLELMARANGWAMDAKVELVAVQAPQMNIRKHERKLFEAGFKPLETIMYKRIGAA